MEEAAKNKFDSFIKVAEYWASRHDGRREFEWKMAFGWWGLLVAAINYVHSSFLKGIPLWLYVLIAGAVALILLFSFVFLWLYPLWKANKFDKDKSDDAVRCAQAILNSPTQFDATDRSPKFLRDWSMKFQAFTTLVLLVVLCIRARY